MNAHVHMHLHVHTCAVCNTTKHIPARGPAGIMHARLTHAATSSLKSGSSWSVMMQPPRVAALAFARLAPPVLNLACGVKAGTYVRRRSCVHSQRCVLGRHGMAHACVWGDQVLGTQHGWHKVEGAAWRAARTTTMVFATAFFHRSLLADAAPSTACAWPVSPPVGVHVATEVRAGGLAASRTRLNAFFQAAFVLRAVGTDDSGRRKNESENVPPLGNRRDWDSFSCLVPVRRMAPATNRVGVVCLF